MNLFWQGISFRLVMLFRKRAVSRILMLALSELLEKRVSVPDALEALAGVYPLLGKRLKLAALVLRNGGSLADCCASQLKFLPKPIKRTLALGEQQGLLAEFLGLHGNAGDGKAVAQYWGGTATVIVAAWLAVSSILILVIPTFAKMFADFGVEMPLLTRLVIYCSSFFMKYLLLVIATIWLVVFLLRETRLYTLLLPLQLCYTRSMASATNLLLQSGKQLPDAIRVAGALTGNRSVSRGAEAVIRRMQNGDEPLAAIMAEQRLPRDYRLFLATLLTPEGAATPGTILLDGLIERLDIELSVLNHKTNYYAYLIVSLLVGVLIIAMYLPIFSLSRMVTG